MNTDERACPWCAETIKAAAVVCRFCQRDVSAPQVAQAPLAPAPAELVAPVAPAPAALDVTDDGLGWALVLVPIVGALCAFLAPVLATWITVVVVVVTGTLAAVDNRRWRVEGSGNVLAVFLLWVLGYPLYLSARNKRGAAQFSLIGVPAMFALLGAPFAAEWHKQSKEPVRLGGGTPAPQYASAAPAPAPSAASFQSLLAAIWKNFDDLPAEQKDKAALGRAAQACGALLLRVPVEQREAAGGLVAEAFRKRAAALVNPHAHTTGERDTTLVPSDTLAECLVWGSQWSKGETAESLRGMGFTSVACANGRRWAL